MSLRGRFAGAVCAGGGAVSSAAMADTLTPPREHERQGSGTSLDSAWRVIVLNDRHNSFEGVAFALAGVLPGVTYDQGIAMANKIHHQGLAIVWEGHLEAAELYWEQLAARGLTMAPLEQG